jgi:hypothetical protein
MTYIFITLFITITLFIVIFTHTLWKFNSRFYQNPDATKSNVLGFTIQRIIGIILLGFAVLNSKWKLEIALLKRSSHLLDFFKLP